MTGSRLSVVAIVATLAVAGVATPVAGQSDDGGFLDGVLSDEDSDDGDDSLLRAVADGIVRITSGFSKTVDRVQLAVTGADGEAAEDYAVDVAETVADNRADLRAYINARVDASGSYDVFRVHVHDRDGGNVTRYVVATVDNGSYATGPTVLTPEGFDKRNRSVDHWVSLDWYASRHADEELQTVITEFVSAGEDVSQTTKANMLRKYRGSVKSSLWGDQSPSFEEGS